MPLADIQPHSIVEVRVESDALVVDYTDSTGRRRGTVTPLADDTVSWNEESLTVSRRPGGIPIAPGLSYERVSMQCRRGDNGCLILEWSYREYGLALFILPFGEMFGGRAELEPA